MATQLPYGMTPDQFASTFAKQAVGGGNPYGPPPGAPKPAAAPQPQNGLAAFANSPMGKAWAAANATVNNAYGAPGGPNPYMDQFQAGLTQARSSIAAQLQGSLADIANSQRLAGEALGHYAPMVNNDWQEGQAMNAAAGRAGAAALSKYGAGAGVVNADLAPEMAATKATHNEDLAMQSLIGSGIAQAGAHDRALAQLAAQQDYGQLAQSQMQFDAQMAQQQAQNEADRQNALAQFGLGMIGKAQDFRSQLALNRDQRTSAANTNPATGPYAQYGLTQGEVDKAKGLPQYGRFSTMINKYKPGTNEARTAAGIIMQATSSNPALQQVLMADNPNFFQDAISVQDQDTSTHNPWGQSVWNWTKQAAYKGF